MATFTVSQFDSADGAEQVLGTLERLQKEELIRIEDAAIVTWAEGAKKPKTRQLHNLKGAGAMGGAFWGLLFGLIFFVPLLGLAVGAAAGALGGSRDPLAHTLEVEADLVHRRDSSTLEHGFSEAHSVKSLLCQKDSPSPIVSLQRISKVRVAQDGAPQRSKHLRTIRQIG